MNLTYLQNVCQELAAAESNEYMTRAELRDCARYEKLGYSAIDCAQAIIAERAAIKEAAE